MIKDDDMLIDLSEWDLAVKIGNLYEFYLNKGGEKFSDHISRPTT